MCSQLKDTSGRSSLAVAKVVPYNTENGFHPRDPEDQKHAQQSQAKKVGVGRPEHPEPQVPEKFTELFGAKPEGTEYATHPYV